jgi:glucose/arabinose dehydrogenase
MPTGEIKTTVLAKGLEIPWSVVFLPDGTALMSQREKGVILSFDPKTGKTATVQTLPSKNIGEGGLLGLAVSPTYAQDKFVYAYYTTDTDNRVVRFQLGGKETMIITGIPNGTYHNGGRIAFGPDGLLYIGTGDATKSNNAQDIHSLSGKILRLTPDGKVPSTNPFPDNPVYTYGHRNVQGLAWNSKGELYASELGQDTYDEINHIVAGDNYGWPVVEGIGKQTKYHDPITTFTTAEASPSGVTFLNNGAIPQWEGSFFMTSLRGQQLWRVVIDDTGKMVSKEALYKGTFGRLRCIIQAPDGSLWLTTTNHDQNGKPGADDDRLIRIYVDSNTTTSPTDNDDTNGDDPTS